MGETICFIIVECACFSSTPQMTSLHRHCHSRWLYLAIITILSEVAAWPAIPPLGDVATSALTQPTRRMCNQSTGHRGGQGVVPPAGFSPLRLTPVPPLLMDAQCQGHLQVAGCTLPLPHAPCPLALQDASYGAHLIDTTLDVASASLEGVITFLLKPPQTQTHTHSTGVALSSCIYGEWRRGNGASKVPNGKLPWKLRLVSGVHKNKKKKYRKFT